MYNLFPSGEWVDNNLQDATIQKNRLDFQIMGGRRGHITFNGPKLTAIIDRHYTYGYTYGKLFKVDRLSEEEFEEYRSQNCSKKDSEIGGTWYNDANIIYRMANILRVEFYDGNTITQIINCDHDYYYRNGKLTDHAP